MRKCYNLRSLENSFGSTVAASGQEFPGTPGPNTASNATHTSCAVNTGIIAGLAGILAASMAGNVILVLVLIARPRAKNGALATPADTHQQEKEKQVSNDQDYVNQDYVLSPVIPLEANQCYGTSDRRTDYDQLYATVEGEQNAEGDYTDLETDYVVP